MSDWSILRQTAKDLINKKAFPEYALSYLKDPSMMKSAMKEWNGSPFKSYRCPECNRTITGPKSWMIQHVKIHHNAMKQNENEIRETKVNPYWEMNRIRI